MNDARITQARRHFVFFNPDRLLPDGRCNCELDCYVLSKFRCCHFSYLYLSSSLDNPTLSRYCYHSSNYRLQEYPVHSLMAKKNKIRKKENELTYLSNFHLRRPVNPLSHDYLLLGHNILCHPDEIFNLIRSDIIFDYHTTS